VTGHEDNRNVGTEQIWECSLLALNPGETADPRMWALMLLRETVMRLEPYAWENHVGPRAKTMLSLFEPKQDLGVITESDSAGRQ
jgi:hypothetical protein